MCRVFNPRDTTYVMSREGMIWEADHFVHFIIDPMVRCNIMGRGL